MSFDYQFRVNDRVRIVGGTYKRYGCGRVMSETKFKVKILVDHINSQHNLMKTSVVVTPNNSCKRSNDECSMVDLRHEIRKLQMEISRLRIAVEEQKK